MGILVTYSISLSGADLKTIGEALDALPHGRVAKLVASVQTQINAQETVERDAAARREQDAIEAWRTAERDRITADLVNTAKPKPTSKRRKGS